MALATREDLRKQLKEGVYAPVYTLFGAEGFLRDVAAKALTDKILRDAPLREFNESAFDLNESDIRHALSIAEQMPMIAAKRVVKVQGLNKLKEADEDVLARYLENPLESCVLIFTADEIDKRRKISKLLLDKSFAVEFAPLRDLDLLEHARKHLQNQEIFAEPRVLQQIINLVGSDLRTLTTELDKLAAASFPERKISENLVSELVANSREISNFDLTEHLLAKNKPKTLQTLKKILDDGAEPLMLLGLIASNFRRLALANAMIKNGVSQDELFRAVKLPPNKKSDFYATARRADAHKLGKIIERIAETDVAIKNSQATPRLQIEMLVLELLSSKF